MNRGLFRLVFDDRRGQRVAVAEQVRRSSKAASGGCNVAAVRAARVLAFGCSVATVAAQAQPASARPAVVFASQLGAPRANLPVPYSGGQGAKPFVYDVTKGSGSADLAQTGQVGWSVSGKTANFNQGNVNQVVVNWDSFDIGSGYKVNFLQNPDPTVYVSALNRVWGADPSLILGQLSANREVILVNANGVYFGRGARIDTGKFVASSLSLADSVFRKGLRNVTDGSAVFTADGSVSATDVDGNPTRRDYLPANLSGAVSVEAGAEIHAAAGGDVLLIAPRVVNQGRIETPQGQTVLAAGCRVYLMSSSDPAQRGLIVAVDPIQASGAADTTLGIAENDAHGSYKTVNGETEADTTPDSTAGLINRINEIRAESGTVNLVGLTVRQNGLVNATTAVRGANGAIYLQAMASTVGLNGDPSDPNGAASRGLLAEVGSQVRVGATMGSVAIGSGSVTAVQPAAGGATQLDAEVFNPSRIRVEGAAISVGSGAQVLAPAGRIELLAARDATASAVFDAAPGVLGSGDDSRIVVAPGATISAAGVQHVEVDGSRNQGAQRLFSIELADSPVQRGGPLYRNLVYFDLRDAGKITAANISGAAASITRTAEEHSTAGGTINVLTDGALVVGQGATFDVSGGSVHYGAARISNSLVSQDGRVVTFSKALGGLAIDALLPATQVSTVPAYTEGENGGSLVLSARLARLDGDFVGKTMAGELQASGNSVLPVPASLAVGMRTESTYALPVLRLTPAPVTPLSDDWFSAPFTSPLAALQTGAELSLAQVAVGGFGKLTLRASAVSQPAFGALNLGPGGSLAIEGDTVRLDGAIHAAGGQISVATTFALGIDEAGDLAVSGRSVFDAAGPWTNLSQPGSASSSGVNGGKVALNAAHSLTLGAGALVDVSGGARLAANGTVTQGKAGSINLGSGSGIDNVTRPPSRSGVGELAIDGAVLRGFDFTSGGAITVSGPAVTIGGDPPAEGVRFDAVFFDAGGFGTVALNSAGSLRVASGTVLSPQLRNWQFSAGWRYASSGAMSDGVAQPITIDTALADRKPVNLSLKAFGALTVERGASITLDPGAALSLASGDSLLIGAGGPANRRSLLVTPGGSITLTTTGQRSNAAGDDALGFFDDQAIWLGAGADLSVAGAAQLRRVSGGSRPAQFTPGSAPETSVLDRITGTVLGGGAIALNAARGYVVAQAGSTMDLDGASASVNLGGLANAVTVAKPGGTLSISAPEGFALEGRVSARAPRDAAGRALADGGSLSLAVGRYGVYTGTAANTVGAPYDTGPRTVSVGGDELRVAGLDARPGADLTMLLGNGTGFVRGALLKDPGWSALTLAAGDRVNFATSLTLNLPLGLSLDAPAVSAAPGVKLDLQAGSAQLGDAGSSHRGATPDTSAQADKAADSSTSLRIAAPTVDVYGNVGLKGFSAVTLDAGAMPGGEIRFSAAAPNFGRAESLSRQLAFAGTLDLVAGQVYATSATQYKVQGLDGSKVSIRRPAGNEGLAAPLSAYGSISVSATDIDQSGTLRQPFGRITLAARGTLELGDGSVTSVSGDGATVLYGQTHNLDSWVVPGGDDTFFSLASTKAVTLTASRVMTSPTAIVSAAGGGVLRAWEFFPGVGGSKDYFESSGLYAVLPDYAKTQTLAVDGGIVAGAAYGQQVVITQAGSGLAPGRYTLLPARDALLGDLLGHGAFLVSRAADQGTSALRVPSVLDDGSVVVTGYLARSGSITVGVPGERFVVESASTFGAKSDIRLSDVSTLLTSRAASGLTVPPLPHDAGRLALEVSGRSPSQWLAQIELGGTGGRAGTLDVAAPSVALVDDMAKAAGAALGIAASTLQSSSAGSILLGGTRTGAAMASDACTPQCIDSSQTRSVSVDLGPQPLRVEELLLAASDHIGIANGTTLAATEAGSLGARSFAAQGDGALAVVSANPIAVSRRAVTPGSSSTLTVGAGSRLTGASISLDASGQLLIDPRATLAGSALDIGAKHLIVGQPAVADASATTLQANVLETLRAGSDVSLRAYEAIDFAGQQLWSARPVAAPFVPLAAPAVVKQRLVLDAPILRGVAGADDALAQVDIAAQDLVVRNTSGRTPDDVAAGHGSGTLLLQALPPLRYGNTGGITLGPGAVAVNFEQAALHSGGDIVLAGAGRTATQSDLVLSAARVTAARGADQAIISSGALQIGVEPGSRTLGEAVGFGASVDLTGATFRSTGLIDLPGGRLSLHSSGGAPSAANLQLAAGSLASVAGFQFVGADGSHADGAAGSIDLRADVGRIAVLGTLNASAARSADGAPATGDGGSISLHATGDGGSLDLAQAAAGGSFGRGALLASGGSGSGDRGGRLEIDVRRLASADAAAQAALAGGIDDGFALRVREGDVTLTNDLEARQIALSADAGKLGLDSRLDARAQRGGDVALAAGGDVVLGAAARIDARATMADGRGGDVLVSSSSGRVRIDPAAVLDTTDASGAGGRIVLRARRSDDNASVAIDTLTAANLHGGEIAVEAVRIYQGYDTIAPGVSADTKLGQSTVAADNASFMQQASRVSASLGLSAADAARVQVRPGVEVRADGDLAVDGDWNLATNRPGGRAGFLTLRAGGDLFVNSSINDGFATTSPNAPLVSDRLSWSLRLTAGADSGAALPTAVATEGSGAGGPGDLTIAAGAVVRTGAGRIDLAAGRDVVFGAGDGSTAPGQVYVAGRQLAAQEAPPAALFQSMATKPQFTTGGAMLSVQAGRDVVAPEAAQLVNNWYWRTGLLDTVNPDQYRPIARLAWWTQFNRFGQTLGNFGGGDIQVRGGRDIVNLQAFAPTVGWADGLNALTASIVSMGGGSLDIRAEHDIRGGQFLVGRDSGRLAAGGVIAAADGNAVIGSAVLMLDDGQWRVSGREGVTVDAPFNPTAAPTSASGNRRGVSGYFYNWGAGAALDIVSNAGSVTLQGAPGEGQAGSLGLSLALTSDLAALTVTVPSLRIAAADGIRLLEGDGQGSAVMFPSSRGQLSLWAGGMIELGSASQQLAMADSDPALWGSVRAPGAPDANPPGTSLVPGTLSDSLTLAGLHAGDDKPVQVHAPAAICESLARQAAWPRCCSPRQPPSARAPTPSRLARVSNRLRAAMYRR